MAKEEREVIDPLVEEMHAKVLARVPMTLTLEETQEVLDALGRPFVHPGVPELAKVQEGGAVEEVIEEPVAESAELKGRLPDNFPGHAALSEAGIHTYHQLRKQQAGEGLTAVPGIGDVTAEHIEDALKG